VKRILILGVNGFIGSALTRRILAEDACSVTGVDLAEHRIADLIDHPRFNFLQFDLRDEHAAVDRLIAESDVVLPLAAYATPASYVRDPIGTFELDFEEVLRVVRRTAEAGARLIFPSTSEVYGMCNDPLFDEADSQLVLGPVHKERWIYACSKQLLDRIIWALGGRGLRFTIFRPFNWFGPGQDDIRSAAPGSSRVITQFLGHLLRGEPIQLVGGGAQRRTFTYVDDGIDGLMRILKDERGIADRQIFNLGNPANFVSVRDLAAMLIEELSAFPSNWPRGAAAGVQIVSGLDYYGAGYEDVVHRRPSIANARRLGWSPQVDLRQGLRKMLFEELSAGDWPSLAAAPPIQAAAG
jgi:nucleoside-diphosphate-sugar epimerase